MAKHSVDVLVKARDEASRKFGIIAGSAAIMGKALKSVASITRTAFATAFRIAKRAVMGLAAAFAYCTYVAIKQEAAEVELASALKVTGQYSEETMQKLKQQAAAIQDATTYGDEYILSLMRMALTLGVTADKTDEAAKAAIALHAGYGGGRGKPEIFMRYYIDALRGTTSSLATYIGELRKAKTQEEKTKILQDALAKGWDVAKSKTESAGGALKQMKNKLGDVAEAIAWPFLPGVAKAAKAVKQWAADNEADILFWAQKVHSSVVFVKDVMWDFVLFMKKDWRAGLAWVFDSFLKLLKAAFKTAVLLAIAGGKGIWQGIKKGLHIGEKYGLRKEMERIYGAEHPGTKLFPAIPPEVGVGALRGREYEELKKRAEQAILKRQTEKILGGTLEAVGDTFKDAFTDILKDMPSDLRKETQKAWEEHQRRLKELIKPSPRRAKPEEAGVPGIFSMAKEIKDIVSTIRIRQQLPAREARFLAFGPGAQFDYSKKTSQNTGKMVNLLGKIDKGIQHLKKPLTVKTDLVLTNFS